MAFENFNSAPADGVGGNQDFKNFQLTKDAKSKLDPAFGKPIAKYIGGSITGTSGYYFNRNTRIAKNRSMAAGRYDMSRFMDRLDMNGKDNYINMNWLPFHIVNTIISRKVGSWMGRREKVTVKAIDSGSVKTKQDQYEEAEFNLAHQAQLEQLQQASGVPMTGPNQFIPEDKDQLDLWASEDNRVPQEIKYEKGCNDIYAKHGFFGVIKEKQLHDTCEAGLVGIYVSMDENGNICPEYIKPENMIYSYSEYPDFRDCSWMGDMASMKISTLRKKYGAEFGGKLSEEEIWKIAQTAKEYQLPDKIKWLSDWSYSMFRPYDEWNIDYFRFQVRSVDSQKYQMKVSNKGTLLIEREDSTPSTLGGNVQSAEDETVNIYEGIYARSADVMLEWGLKKNTIRPQDPAEINQAEFNYSYYMYQNMDMRNIAIPEKIEAPFEGMIIALLKIQQTIMLIKPVGCAINWDAIQEIDYGTGDKKVDHRRMYEQTGSFYYRSRDAEGNPISIPFTELSNAGFLPQLEGLWQTYAHYNQVIKDELGEDPNLVSQAAQPRVTEGNIQTSIQQADNATDYMYDAWLYTMEGASRKIACLLNDSVTYGSKIYSDILHDEDVKGRVFSTDIKMLPTDLEVQKLEVLMNNIITNFPDFILYCDPFRILRIAKEDVKLAEVYLRNAQKRMLAAKQQESAQNSQLQAQAASKAAKDKAEGEMAHMQMELKLKAETSQMDSDNRKEEILLNGFMHAISKGVAIPPEWVGVQNEIIANVALPLFAKNHQAGAAIGQAMAQNEEEQGEPEMEGNPEGQMAEQEQPQMQIA
jgi:hypothetical protein